MFAVELHHVYAGVMLRVMLQLQLLLLLLLLASERGAGATAGHAQII